MADETTGIAGLGAAGFAGAAVDTAGPSPSATSATSATGVAGARGPAGLPDPRSDDELLIDLDAKFRLAVDHPTWTAWRTNALKCFQYKENEQWTEDEKKILKDRGQPETVNNQIYVTIKRLVGQFVAQRTRLGFRGRNAPDQVLGETLSDILLYVKQQTGEEYEEREQADDGFTGGFGVVAIESFITDLLTPQIRVQHKDCFTIFPDPFSRRYDWNDDAAFICEAPWTDVEELIALYPEHKRDLTGMVDSTYSGGALASIDGFKNDYYVDATARRIRPVEVWYKRKARETTYVFENGDIAHESQISKRDLAALKRAKVPFEKHDQVKTTMHVGVFLSGLLLERKPSPYQHGLFKYVPYFVHRKKSGEPYSPIFIALPLQDAINKRESKAIHLLNANATITEENNIVDKDEYAKERARPDGIAVVRDLEKLKTDNNVELAVSQMEFHRESKGDFRRVTGINPDALGEKSEVRSGVVIARKQAMTDLIVTPDFDNFRRTRAISAKVKLGIIKQFFTAPMVFSITDDLGKTRAINLDQNVLTTLKQQQFDVIVEDLPDVTTIQQEQFATITQVLPSILPFGPFWVKKLIQMSDIRHKEELVKEIEEQSAPPPPEPKISLALQWSELVPEEKAAFAMKFGMPELAQFEAQAGSDPAHITKSKVDLHKAELAAQADDRQAEGDRVKTGMEMAKGEQTMAHQREKHGLDMEKQQMGVDAAAMKSMMPQPTRNGGRGA